ncbi:MAG: PAS domain S-box protein [Anaerolineae bacterium]|nr:PAS domain S-box protein [Anaerolineae bacterium]
MERRVSFWEHWRRPILQGIGIGVVLWVLGNVIQVVGYGSLRPMNPIQHTGAGLNLLFFIVLGILFAVHLAGRKRSEDQLRKLSRAVQQSPSMVMITDLDGAIEYVNPKFTDVTGHTLADVRGANPRILNAGMSQVDYKQMWLTIMGGDEWHGDFHNVKKNGDRYWVRASISGVKNAEGVITHYLSVQEDITELKLIQAAEREQRALAEALRDIAVTINSTLEPDIVLDNVLLHLHALVPHDAAAISLFESDAMVVARVCPHVDPATRARLMALRLPLPDQQWLESAAQTGRARIITDTRRFAHWPVASEMEWLRSYIGVPIHHEGTVIGMLNLASAKENAFDQAYVNLLQTLAPQVAVAIENARLYAAEREQRTLAEALRDGAAALNSSLQYEDVLERILEQVGRVVAHDAANIMVIENGIAFIKRSRGYERFGLEDAVMKTQFEVESTPGLRHMVQTGQPFIVYDTEQYPNWVEKQDTRWAQSYLGAPIQLGGEVIGILGLDSAHPGAFTDEHAERLQVFANQAALAIRNAQLYNEVQDHVDRLGRAVAERTVDLAQQRAQLRVILDAMSEGVLYLEGNTVRYTNRALGRLFGYEDHELPDDFVTLYNKLTESNDDIVQFRAAAWHQLRGDRTWRGQMLGRRRDGSTFDLYVTSRAVLGPEGDPIGSVTVVRDVSQEKELEERKTRFLTHAAHELRTPISNIKTRLYLLRNQPERYEQHVSVIEQVSDGLMHLAEDLLDVVRLAPDTVRLARQMIVLQTLIHDVTTRLTAEAERQKVDLVADLPDQPVRLAVDQPRLGKALMQLVSYALHHTPSGRCVRIELSHAVRDAVPHVVIRVIDQGEGLDADEITQVFEPFFRAREGDSKGLGLGLAVAKQIVDLHGGVITVDSQLGHGSTFTIWLAMHTQSDETKPVKRVDGATD